MFSIKIEEMVIRYSNMLFKICLVILGNEQDVQDAIQDTFYRYLSIQPEFVDDEHEKAWLIRVALNISKDMRRFQQRHPKVSVEQLENYSISKEEGGILEKLLALTYKLKIVVYLHYIEGYQINEIASMLNISASAVKKRLQRGRERLKLSYEENERNYAVEGRKILKEVMEKINIKSEIEEEILKNVINEETNRNQGSVTTKKRKKWQNRVVAAAVTIVVAGGGGVTAHALADSLVKERMESMPEEEVKDIVDEIDSQQVEASTYSRELTDTEKERMKDLAIAYQKGQFPEGELKRVEDESQVDKDVLCFVPNTSYFYLPDRELTDEELLQMIDYNKKADYALQKRYEEEYAEEVQAKEEERQELAQTTQAEGGISEGEAIAKAEEWLTKLYGETPDGMEMVHYIESAEESVATSLDGSAVYCIGYSIAGSGNYYFYISGNGDLLSAEHNSAGQLDAAELTLSEAESKVQTLYQTAEEQLKDSFGISEDYAEVYCRYGKNTAGDGIDMNLMNFYFVKEDRTAYKLSFTCDNMEMIEYSIKNFDEVIENAKEIEEMGLVNESIQTKLK